MPKMKTQGPAADVHPLNLAVHQADSQFGILPAPANKGLIVTIDLEQVFAPNTQIASANPM